MTQASSKPYSMEEQPTSPGRVFLARALSHWCAVHHGLSVEEVEAGLDGTSATDSDTAHLTRSAARLLGELAASGTLLTYARPIGGGETFALKPATWELDDFRSRMAASALDPRNPFDPSAAPTHWIFLDLDRFNAVVAESCGGSVPAAADAARQDPAGGAAAAAPAPTTDRASRLLRLPEVMARTGMSRSTIYNRIRETAFPPPVPMGGNMSGWREWEVETWIRERGR